MQLESNHCVAYLPARATVEPVPRNAGNGESAADRADEAGRLHSICDGGHNRAGMKCYFLSKNVYKRLRFCQSDVLNRQKRKTALAGGGFKTQKMHDSLVRKLIVSGVSMR